MLAVEGAPWRGSLSVGWREKASEKRGWESSGQVSKRANC